MMNIKTILDQLGLDTNLTLEEIPNIDLYMDQVIQLFENKFNGAKRNDEEKILTKTMINNYAKGKLIFPIKNKKYSKEHLILISLIYQLKGALSIHDIKVSLEGINNRIINDNLKLDTFYQCYLNIINRNVVDFYENIENKNAKVNEEILKLDGEHSHYLERTLMIASLIHMSNLYRKVAEKLIDEIDTEQKEMVKK